LAQHEGRIASDPQSNPVKLLAYDISKAVEDRSLAFRDIEALVKIISDKNAISRATRLGKRSGITSDAKLKKQIATLALSKAKQGFDAFQLWAETAAQGIVLTAHPTFSLSRDVRDTLGAIASSKKTDIQAHRDHLKTLPFLQKSTPTLQEEHIDTQATILRLQIALENINDTILDIAAKTFPNKWTVLTPNIVKIYSWVGYDIDGRTDIGWADAIRLRLQEKCDQLKRYHHKAQSLRTEDSENSHLDGLCQILEQAHQSTSRDLMLFNEDMSVPDNLIAAANNLTRKSDRRIRSTKTLFPLLQDAINSAKSPSLKRRLILLRSSIRTFGLGTARIHFRVNSRHVINGVRAAFGIKDSGTDTRTLLQRASEKTRNVKPLNVNFASLELEQSVAHRQMMLIAQIHKYIDEETPIRMLIAECEDSLIPLGMLYLARLYGLDKHLDISPLFETAEALNNGGRIITKMLSNPVYGNYIKQRGIFAIQTGFSDAGRFMGQIPATLSIERLQSHLASALKKSGLTDVMAIVFNTHGESMGRGGHPGTLKNRTDYVMSPWAISQFDNRDVALCHETSFQGGDGFLWFQTDRLALASLTSLITARHSDHSEALEDPFYTDRDFSWDVFRTLSGEQNELYKNPNYVNLLSGFGQNLLIPTGSRAVKRTGSNTKAQTFDPRQLRAIPHNAILQQFGAPANVFYGISRAGGIDPEKFAALLKHSDRARSIFEVARIALLRTNISILTGYGRLFDPGFWISRALSGNEPQLSDKSLRVAETLKTSHWRQQITDLSDHLRIDMYESRHLVDAADTPFDDQSLKILHALRLAVIMKILILATDLPTYSSNGTSQLDILQRLQNFQIDSIIEDLEARFPANTQNIDWSEALLEGSDLKPIKTQSFPHIAETVIKPMKRGAELVRQITIAITHSYDAFG